jgi:glycosyltransferase involved in cell wall biosynthesis
LGQVPLSVVIITYNEERNLTACLSSVVGWAGQLFVVDSGSTDCTVKIATTYGACVVTHAFESHARQWNWALRNLPLSYEWALCLDADQRVTPALRDEIGEIFGIRSQESGIRSQESGVRGQTGAEGVDGFYVKRRQVFRGQWIKYGGYYPKYLLKLFRRERAWLDEGDMVDHHFYVEGRTLKLQHDLVEENGNENDIVVWSEKHLRYARRQALEELRSQQKHSSSPLVPSLCGTPDQHTLWLKRLWSRLPLYVRPFLYFVYRYFFRLGFLDGKQGFLFHFLQGFWYRLLIDVVLDDLRRDALKDQQQN